MRICLVGASHPCHNPRLTREADSLVEAGHEVRVVAPAIMEYLAHADRRLMATRKWRLQVADFCPIGVGGKWRALVTRGKRRIASEFFEKFGGDYLAETSYTAALSQLKRLAKSEPADWFIAHTQAALPIAVGAARRWNARVGFDCEDLLSEMDNNAPGLARRLEKKYLPYCDYVSVPSQRISERLVSEYRIEEPLVLYNVFPTKLASTMSPPTSRERSETLRVHWFSQTIGPGRGIEDAIEGLGRVKGPVELHLRGTVSEGYRTAIEKLALRHEVRMFLLPQIDHDLLIESMEGFDVGLALERVDRLGVALTVANKIFSYMLAGLAVAATDTPGQREVMDRLGDSGFVYPPGETHLLSEGLQEWFDDREKLLDAKMSSWISAREKYCWDVEKVKFLERIEGVDQIFSEHEAA